MKKGAGIYIQDPVYSDKWYCSIHPQTDIEGGVCLDCLDEYVLAPEHMTVGVLSAIFVLYDGVSQSNISRRNVT